MESQPLEFGTVLGYGARGTAFVAQRQTQPAESATPPFASNGAAPTIPLPGPESSSKTPPDALVLKTTPLALSDSGSLQAEIRALARLRHDNLVRYEGLYVHRPGRRGRDEVWVAQELFHDSVSLHDLIHGAPQHHDDAAAESLVAQVATQVVDALAYLHSKGHNHGQLHLGNVLINRKGHVKLSDYGLARETRRLWNASARLASIWSGKGNDLLRPTTTPFADDVRAVGTLIGDMTSQSRPSGRRQPGPQQHSLLLRDFVALCLRRRQGQAVSARELRMHGFLKQSATTVLAAWVSHAIEFTAAKRVSSHPLFDPSEPVGRLRRTGVFIEAPIFRLDDMLTQDLLRDAASTKSHDPNGDHPAQGDTLPFRDRVTSTLRIAFVGDAYEEAISEIEAARAAPQDVPHGNIH